MTRGPGDRAGRVIEGADLDHVAVAAESRPVLEPRYADDLGGLALSEGTEAGFRWAQLEYANGMVVEMLEPDRVEDNDFLRRFLDRSGPGPHHLTFKVPDFHAALGQAEAAGHSPVGVDDSDPYWKEAFLHPKDATGVVVQLAESHEAVTHPPRDPARPGASLLHVAHCVSSMEEGRRLFGELLGGATVDEGEGADHRWVELAWPGPGRLRLLAPKGAGPVRDWLGPRRGRVHHLAFALAEPSRVPGAQRAAEGWTVRADQNLGTGLVLKGV